MPSCDCPNLLANCIGVDSPITGTSSLTADHCYFYASCSARADIYAPAILGGGIVTQQCAYTVLSAETQAEANALASAACGANPSGGGGSGDGGNWIGCVFCNPPTDKDDDDSDDGDGGGGDEPYPNPYPDPDTGNSLCLMVESPAEGQTPITYTVSGPNSGDDWTFTATNLPPGMSLNKVSHNSAELVGTPTAAGNYAAVVTASLTLNPNMSVQLAETIPVLGITNNVTVTDANSSTGHAIPLDVGAPLEEYSIQLRAEGGKPDITFELSTETVKSFNMSGISTSIPWFTITPDGLLAGTPQDSDAGRKYYAPVTIRDADGRTCLQVLSIWVACRFREAPPDGAVCSPYDFQFTTVPANLTYFGSVPDGLAIDSTGHVTGSPTQPTNGPATFNIVAYDPATTEVDQNGLVTHPITCTHQWTIQISGADGTAKSVDAMGDWPLVYSQESQDFELPGMQYPTVVGSPRKGVFTITSEGHLFGTFRRTWACKLTRCGTKPNYPVTADIVITFEPMCGVYGPYQSIGLVVLGTQVYSQNQSPLGGSGHAVVNILPTVDPGGNNMVLDMQFTNAAFPPHEPDQNPPPCHYRCVIQVSITPNEPPP